MFYSNINVVCIGFMCVCVCVYFFLRGVVLLRFLLGFYNVVNLLKRFFLILSNFR